MTQRNQCGFTMIEMLLYISIFAIMLGSITSFFVLSLQSRVRNETIAIVEQEGAAAVSSITQQVRNASDLTFPTTGATASSLTVLDVNGDVVSIELNGAQLEVTDGAVPTTHPITSGAVSVDSFAVKNTTVEDGVSSVQIEFDVSRVNESSLSQYEYTQTFTASASLRY